LPKLGFI